MENPLDMMKQLQARMESLKERVGELRIDGRAGGDGVRVTLDGNFRCQGVDINPDFLKDNSKTVLEDVIAAAFNQAHDGVERALQQETQTTLANELPSGFKMPF